MKAIGNLYFIAIVPPKPVYNSAMQYKEYFARRYNSKAALKSPPHITLHMPFRIKEEKEQLLVDTLKNIAERTKTFNIILNGFGQFNNRTIYIHIEQNNCLFDLFKNIMETMKAGFNIYNADYKNHGFKPHMTLAFRDFRKNDFNEAWPMFRDKVFQHEFLTENFTLLKHNGKNWDIVFTIPLKSGFNN